MQASIFAPAAPRAETASFVVMSRAEFSAWCARQCRPAPAAEPTPIEDATADRIAFEADGGEPDDYRPGWAGDEPYVPSLRETFEEAGQRFGLEGVLLDVAEAFPDASLRDIIRGAHAFAEGQHDGFRTHARRLGYALGLDGSPCDRPESIPSRFELVFECGWHAGSTERADRQQIMADWQGEADADRAEKWHQAEVAEAGGYYRVIPRF